MSDEMTSVYSGGLMYEYSVEDNKYGIVTIKGDDVSHGVEYQNFKKALSKYPTPTGSGGAAKTTHSVDCPSSNANWQIKSNAIPDIPQEAEKYMKDGAGSGPGLKGSGSQTAGDSGTAEASGTSGEASPTASSQQGNNGGDDDDSAAVSMRAVGLGPMYVTAGALALSFVGALLL